MAEELYRAHQVGGEWSVQREYVCGTRGAKQWFAVVICDPLPGTYNYTDGAFGTAQERAEQIASALNAQCMPASGMRVALNRAIALLDDPRWFTQPRSVAREIKELLKLIEV